MRRLFKILQETFQQRVFSKREAEYKKMKKEQEDRINQIIQSRQQERETRRKMICYIKIEEERQKKLRAEEEARQREGINHRMESLIPIPSPEYVCVMYKTIMTFFYFCI